MAEEKEIGVVFAYFSKVGVAAAKLSGNLKIGDKILIKGHTTNFEQEVRSMQVDNKEVEEAKKGNEIGIKVDVRVRPKDKIYKA